MSLPIGPSWLITHLGLKYPAIALCACACGYLAFPSYSDAPMVSITFDDGRKSQLEALPILNGLPATSYIHTNDIGNPNYLNVYEIRMLSNEGWEIGSHTISHPYLTELEPANMMHEITYPARYLESIVGHPIFSFASPYGEYNDQVVEVVSWTYDSHVNAWSENEGINIRETFDPYNIHRFDVTSDISSEYVCERIANLEPGEWYILLFHALDEEGRWSYTSEDFRKIVECLEVVDVVTITEGADRFSQ